MHRDQVEHFLVLSRNRAVEFLDVSVWQFVRLVKQYDKPPIRLDDSHPRYLKADLINLGNFVSVDEVREYRQLEVIQDIIQTNKRTRKKFKIEIEK